MKKILAAVIAAAFALTSVSVLAAEEMKKDEMKMEKKEAKKAPEKKEAKKAPEKKEAKKDEMKQDEMKK